MNDKSKKISQLEALLFQYGKPISYKKVSNILDLDKKGCQEIIEEYEANLKEDKERGLCILKKEKKIQLATKPNLKNISQEIAKEEFTEELTPAALETLTLIAYLGPVPRTTVDFIRGVNSSYILRNLLMRGLIERERSGHTFNYQVTFDFLKHLGLSSIKELPEYEKYKNILEEYETNI